MIFGLVQILLFQSLGELVSKFLLPTLPGPVIGLVLLVLWLVIRKGVNAELAMVADLVRELGPGRVHRLDANGAYTVPTARQVCHRLADLGRYFHHAGRFSDGHPPGRNAYPPGANKSDC